MAIFKNPARSNVNTLGKAIAPLAAGLVLVLAPSAHAQRLRPLFAESCAAAYDLTDPDLTDRALHLAAERLPSLTPTARMVVWLYEVEGWSHEEIARSFGRTVSFSKSQLARAHQRLRVWFEPEPSQTCTPT